ncbi:hypothetical protein P3S68_030150 [Capsicum galapagoense]
MHKNVRVSYFTLKFLSRLSFSMLRRFSISLGSKSAFLSFACHVGTYTNVLRNRRTNNVSSVWWQSPHFAPHNLSFFRSRITTLHTLTPINLLSLVSFRIEVSIHFSLRLGQHIGHEVISPPISYNIRPILHIWNSMLYKPIST